MTKFGKFLKKYDININDVKKNYEYSTYTKWRNKENSNPTVSSLLTFQEYFGDKYQYDMNKLTDCFDKGIQEEDDDFIVTITGHWLPRRSLSIAEYIIRRKYLDKKVLLINATPYGDIEKSFGIADNQILKPLNINIYNLQELENIKEYICKTQYEKLDIIHLSHIGNGEILLSEDEDTAVKILRECVTQLQEYDKVLVVCAFLPTAIKRLLGAIANVCVIFKDTGDSSDTVKKLHTVGEFNDRIIFCEEPDIEENLSKNHNEDYLKEVGEFYGNLIGRRLN